MASSKERAPYHSFAGADAAVAADQVDAAVYFQRMIVRIAKLDRDLTSSAAPPLKIDLRPKLAQAIARGDHLPQG